MSVSEELRKLQDVSPVDIYGAHFLPEDAVDGLNYPATVKCKCGANVTGVSFAAMQVAFALHMVQETLLSTRPLIALAEQQERELALANFRRDTWKGQCEARDEIIEALKRELAALKEAQDLHSDYHRGFNAGRRDMAQQHSADLREVAEMAIAAQRQYTAKALTWNGGKEPQEPTPDSILAEFREKKGVQK